MASAAALSPKLVSLHYFPSGLLLVAAAAVSPKLVSFHYFPSGLLLVVAAALSSKLASLPEFSSGLLLFLFLLHPFAISVLLLVRSYLLFAACSCLGFLGVVDVIFCNCPCFVVLALVCAFG